MKYLISQVDTYVVESMPDVETLHEELKDCPTFTLASFSWKAKEVKSKGEVIDTYYVVTAKKVFNNEKDPDTIISINYEVE
jgi:hypothetical protein